MTTIDEAEATLIAAMREIAYGEITPNALAKSGVRVTRKLHWAEERLLKLIAQCGTPDVVKVQDGIPVSAEFTVETGVGPGRKKIKIA